jgi:hypothetical protein
MAQVIQAGPTVSASLVGTGSAATLYSAVAGAFININSLILTNATPATAAAVILSDGTLSYTFNTAQPLPISFVPPLPASKANAAWTLNAPAAVNAVAVATIISQ